MLQQVVVSHLRLSDEFKFILLLGGWRSTRGPSTRHCLFPFWRVSVAALSPRELSEPRAGRGDPFWCARVEPLAYASPLEEIYYVQP
jgi:hypothetical protein